MVLVIFHYQNNILVFCTSVIWWRHLPAASYNFFSAGVTGFLQQPLVFTHISLIYFLQDSFMGFGTISDTVQLSLVEAARVTPDTISVFNHPQNVEFASVQAGSGFFEISGSDVNVAATKFISSNQSISIRE
jgi:hypothetical protein